MDSVQRTKFQAAKRVLVLTTAVASVTAGMSAQAATVLKDNNLTDLNQGASWVGGVAPTATDVAAWDVTVAAAQTLSLGGDVSWQGIQVTSPAGAITINPPAAPATGTLTLGSAGVDMSTATQNMSITAPVAMGSSSTWNVGTGRTITLTGGLSGAGMVMTKTGAGTVSVNAIAPSIAKVQVDAGIFNSNAGSATTAVALNGGQFTLGNSMNNPVEVMAGGGTIFRTANRTYNGNLTGSGALTWGATGGLGTVGGLATDNSAFAGSFTFAGTGAGVNSRFSGLGAGSAAASWIINAGNIVTTGANFGNALLTTGTIHLGSLAGSGTLTQAATSTTYSIGALGTSTNFLGNITGAVSITKVGAGTLTLSGASSYTGATTINAGTVELGFANERLADTSTMTLGGGTFNTAGFDETLGVLTLAASSAIDLGTGTDSVLKFANSSVPTWTGVLTINNWSGSTSGGGTEALFVGTDATGLTAAQLAQINFTGYAPGAAILSTGEVIPVPEPTSFALLGLAGFGLAARRRRN